MNYEELKTEYKALADNDPAGAFRLMETASVLAEFYEGEKFKWQQDCNDQEAYAKWYESKVALDSNESAAKGALIAKANEQVLAEWKNFNRLIKMVDDCKTKINFLVRVYYDCKEVWLKGENNVGNGRFNGGISTSANSQGNPVRAGQKEWR